MLDSSFHFVGEHIVLLLDDLVNDPSVLEREVTQLLYPTSNLSHVLEDHESLHSLLGQTVLDGSHVHLEFVADLVVGIGVQLSFFSLSLFFFLSLLLFADLVIDLWEVRCEDTEDQIDHAFSQLNICVLYYPKDFIHMQTKQLHLLMVIELDNVLNDFNRF